MRQCFVPLCIVLLLVAAPSLRAEESAADLEAKGIDALKLAQNQPDAIVMAAIYLGKAQVSYEKSGDEAKTVEMNSLLYWCRKKMTLQQMDSFLKGDASAAALAERMSELEKAAPKPEEANTYIERAEAYANAHSGEHLLVAIRFFEIADRFKETDLKTSTAAMDRSLKEMQQIQNTVAAKIEQPKPRVVAQNPEASATGKYPIPDAGKIKDAEKTIKELFKDDYAKRNVDDKKLLGQKLLVQARDTKDDLSALYVLLRESIQAAAQGGDAETAISAIDQMARVFVVDGFALKADALAKTNASIASPDAAKALAHAYLAIAESAIAEDNYDVAIKMLTSADAAVRRGQDAALAAQIQARTKDVRAIQTDFVKIKAAQKKLQETPGDAEANLAVGKFLCFSKDSWEQGLPNLAKGNVANLKESADLELSAPTDAEKVVLLADGWWNVGEKLSGSQKTIVQSHAAKLYRSVLPGLTGLTKARVLARVAPVSTAGWVVLLSSDDPTIWNTKSQVSGNIAVPVSEAPENMRYLRLLRKDTNDYIVLPVKKAN